MTTVVLDSQGFPLITVGGTVASSAWVPPSASTVAPPTPGDLARYLGWVFDVEMELSAQVHLDRATTVVLAVTRGRGAERLLAGP